MNEPLRRRPQMCVNPRKLNVSGLPSPCLARDGAAKRPKSIRRVVCGCSDSPNCSMRARLRQEPLCVRPRFEADSTDLAVSRDAGFQPLANQPQNARIADAAFDKPNQPFVADAVEELGHICVHDNVHRRVRNPDGQRVERVVLAASRPRSIRKPEKGRRVPRRVHVWKVWSSRPYRVVALHLASRPRPDLLVDIAETITAAGARSTTTTLPALRIGEQPRPPPIRASRRR